MKRREASWTRGRTDTGGTTTCTLRHDKHTRTILAKINVNGRPLGVQVPPPSTPAERRPPVSFLCPLLCLSCGARPSARLNWKAVRTVHYVHGEERWTLIVVTRAPCTVSFTLGGSGGLLTATLGPAEPAVGPDSEPTYTSISAFPHPLFS